MQPPRGDTPYTLLGGSDRVRRIVEAFYDAMDAHEPALAKLHVLDAEGRVAREVRDRFAMFLIGWLGGPQDYIATHGHPRLGMRHARVAIDTSLRDAWVRAMQRALDAEQVSGGVRAFLDSRFFDVATFLINRAE